MAVSPFLKVCSRPWILWMLFVTLAVIVFWQIEPREKQAFKPMDANFDVFVVQPFPTEAQMKSLPNLKALNWPTMPVARHPAGAIFPNGTMVPLPSVFTPIMSSAQRHLSERLLSTFSDVMFRHGLGNRFMIYGGTLLGSYRHHDMIPWDDDIDVIVDNDVRKTMENILSQLHPTFTFISYSQRIKFYLPTAHNVSGLEDVEASRFTSEYPWGWPYLDISFYSQNDTHIWDNIPSYGREYVYSKSSIFPLTFRPYGLHWYPAPFNLKRVLLDTYSETDRCLMNGYSHVYERSGTSGSVKCTSLRSKYAFVNRTVLSRDYANDIAWITESLISAGLDSAIVHQLPLPWYLE